MSEEKYVWQWSVEKRMYNLKITFKEKMDKIEKLKNNQIKPQ